MGHIRSNINSSVSALVLSFGLATTLAPGSSAAVEPIGKFTVQVAAFDDEARAKDFTADLKSKGLKPFIIPVQIKGRPWYRVGIGLFSTERETIRFRTQLLSQTKLPEAIVRIVD